MQIKSTKPGPKFEPITLTVEIETQRDYDTIYALGNWPRLYAEALERECILPFRGITKGDFRRALEEFYFALPKQ